MSWWLAWSSRLALRIATGELALTVRSWPAVSSASRRPRFKASYFIAAKALRMDGEFPGIVTLHLILDNYGTHGHERVRQWLAQHPRFVLHFIPTSSSWLNLVERWFVERSQKTVRRGLFRSVQELEQSI